MYIIAKFLYTIKVRTKIKRATVDFIQKTKKNINEKKL